VRINKQFELSPDWQHVRRPAGDAAKDMNLIGLRAEITF